LRGLPEEMDAQRMGSVMADLYGRIWIDLRSSVLDSFKDGMDSVANAEALNPTLTDAQISELTQLAVASAAPRGSTATPLILPQARNTPAREVNRRPSSPAVAIAPALVPKLRRRAGLWLGSAAAVTALISVAALATYQRRATERPPPEQPAEEPAAIPNAAAAVNAPTPIEAAAAPTTPPRPPTAQPGSQSATAGPPQPTLQPGTRHDKAPAHLRAGHASARPSAKTGGNGKIMNPDQPMDPWKP
jgi:hypothetical protein